MDEFTLCEVKKALDCVHSIAYLKALHDTQGDVDAAKSAARSQIVIFDREFDEVFRRQSTASVSDILGILGRHTSFTAEALDIISSKVKAQFEIGRNLAIEGALPIHPTPPHEPKLMHAFHLGFQYGRLEYDLFH